MIPSSLLLLLSAIEETPPYFLTSPPLPLSAAAVAATDRLSTFSSVDLFRLTLIVMLVLENLVQFKLIC